jgi:hypothetical protein
MTSTWPGTMLAIKPWNAYKLRKSGPRRALGWRASNRRSAMWSIEYSIMLRGASIQVAQCTETSLIGHDVEVTPAPRVPPVHQLVLGDHSKVQTSS